MPRATPLAMAAPMALNLLPPLPIAPHRADSAALPSPEAAPVTWPRWLWMPSRTPVAKVRPTFWPSCWLIAARAAVCAAFITCVVVFTSWLRMLMMPALTPVVQFLPSSVPAVLLRIFSAASSAAPATSSTAAFTVSVPPVMPLAISATACV